MKPHNARCAFVFVLAATFFVSTFCEAGMPFVRRKEKEGEVRSSGRVGVFPETGDVETLRRVSDVLTYKPKAFQELYGAAGNRFIQYGMVNLISCNYKYGEKSGNLSIEIANMPTGTAAAGLFHHHRAVVMRHKGRPIDIGAEGMMDAGRENRNLYFYRGNQFIKIVYSGDAPVPPLAPIGDAIDAKLPKGRDSRPDGFEYIDIEGVDQRSVTLTPGFTFGLAFLPPSVTGSSPGAGSPASDLYLITRIQDKEAAEVYKGYSTYLRLNAEYYEEYTRGGKQKYVKAVDPRQGRVVVTAYKNCVIIAARPDGYDRGEELIDRVMEKIDERRNKPKSGAASEDKPVRQRRGIFRRRG